jgi:hypothetical protein
VVIVCFQPEEPHVLTNPKKSNFTQSQLDTTKINLDKSMAQYDVLPISKKYTF